MDMVLATINTDQNKILKYTCIPGKNAVVGLYSQALAAPSLQQVIENFRFQDEDGYEDDIYF